MLAQDVLTLSFWMHSDDTEMSPVTTKDGLRGSEQDLEVHL